MNSFLDFMELKRWMLVDDNDEILLMLSAMLEHLTGAPIECYNSPESALQAFNASPDAYELVITDFDMPGLNGQELCRSLQTLTPAQKVILTTGSGYSTRAGAQGAGFCALLRKPYPLSALQAALAEAGMKDTSCMR